MGLPVLILGETGSGKSYSIKNFDVDEVGIFSVEKPYLPFKKDFKVLKHATYSDIDKVFKDYESVRGTFEDAGVGEEMKALSVNIYARRSFNALRDLVAELQ